MVNRASWIECSRATDDYVRSARRGGSSVRYGLDTDASALGLIPHRGGVLNGPKIASKQNGVNRDTYVGVVLDVDWPPSLEFSEVILDSGKR